jgi:hypothetical protein
MTILSAQPGPRSKFDDQGGGDDSKRVAPTRWAAHPLSPGGGKLVALAVPHAML